MSLGGNGGGEVSMSGVSAWHAQCLSTCVRKRVSSLRRNGGIVVVVREESSIGVISSLGGV